jgi:superfamily II DNA or RNA helicase
MKNPKSYIQEGYYEQVLTKALERELQDLKEYYLGIEDFEKSEGAELIHRHFQTILLSSFRRLAESKGDTAREHIIRLANRLVEILFEAEGAQDLSSLQIADSGNVLKAFFRKESFEHSHMDSHLLDAFPYTGLSTSELFTGSRAGISLESELKKEMLTSDEIWWLVSFVKFEGIRLFEQTLRTLEQSGKPVRILCTVYMGATDLRAIDFLSDFQNVELRISYNTRHERLHAKTYLFFRKTGFHTAYIGSSNISRTALTSGLEWNVKVTSQEIPHIIDKCRSTIETYWNDPGFEAYDQGRDRLKLSQALSKDKRNDSELLPFFDIRPYPYQQEVLDRLGRCRSQGQNRNLVVAATGTGKTLMAAFDFQRRLKQKPTSRLLFVAHREEILRQARISFRQVLRNNDFGELWFSGEEPRSLGHLFVTVQTLNNRIDSLPVSEEFFDYIVIDEVHHGASPSYRKILERFRPEILLGLTATPERLDGFDISSLFGGSISAEIRLPEALNRGLLCPFQYFGISDNTDLSNVSWKRGRYDTSELEKVYGEDERRVLDILRNCHKYLLDATTVRCLGYCASQRHAEFMAISFQKAGLKADYLVSSRTEETGKNFRTQILKQLGRGEINYLFVVDILNEGVDIPEIDTLLFLRPTESLTIFLQQLGRGLRLHEGKSCLTVLDFVGRQHEEYSFEHKFRAMLGRTHRSIRDEVSDGFPHLPLGCSIILEKTAKDLILENIRKATMGGLGRLKREIHRFRQDHLGKLTLESFCRISEIGLDIIYRTGYLFHELVAIADGQRDTNPSSHVAYAKAMGGVWLSTDSPAYWMYLDKYLKHPERPPENPEEEQWQLMFFVDVHNTVPICQNHTALTALLDKELAYDVLRTELLEYVNIRLQSSESIETEDVIKGSASLRVHGRYTRNQVLVGMNKTSLEKLATSREGVLRDHNYNWEVLFVTLDKNTGRFNPSTMYHDYFINDVLFHWQSQNATGAESQVGRSYIEQKQNGKTILLFVREATRDERGITMGFICCGPVEFVSHEGSKPMNITWRMQHPAPASLGNEGRKLAVG